jgi:hypothetical protein
MALVKLAVFGGFGIAGMGYYMRYSVAGNFNARI